MTEIPILTEVLPPVLIENSCLRALFPFFDAAKLPARDRSRLRTGRAAAAGSGGLGCCGGSSSSSSSEGGVEEEAAAAEHGAEHGVRASERASAKIVVRDGRSPKSDTRRVQATAAEAAVAARGPSEGGWLCGAIPFAYDPHHTSPPSVRPTDPPTHRSSVCLRRRSPLHYCSDCRSA